MQLNTDAINDRAFFDSRYTCDSDNSSPELRWIDPPENTAGYALVAEDPDAPSGLFTHWLIYNIPKDLLHLPAGIPSQESLPNGIRQGVNSFGKLGYGGPCPPVGDRPHRYIFRIYALRELPDVPSRSNREQVMSQIMPHVIATAEVMGKYQRAIQRAG